MLAKPQPPRIHLPKAWQGCVKSAVLYVIALAHYAILYARARAADSINARVRLAAENDRLHQECALLHEELRLKDGSKLSLDQDSGHRNLHVLVPFFLSL